MNRFAFELATESDDNALQRILFENPMEGDIRLTFQRNAGYFKGLAVEGKFNQVIVAREKASNELIGFGTRSVRPVYINGSVCDIGYLNNLRLDKAYRGGIILARGYRILKELHDDKRVPAYLTTIFDQNKEIINLLTSKRAGLPTYQGFGLYNTFAISVSKVRKNYKPLLEIKRGSKSDIDEIVGFLNETGKEKQFYPYYTKEDFLNNKEYLMDFNINNFYIAYEGGEIAGVIGLWNQKKFKQTIVGGYDGNMKYYRYVYNLFARFGGISKLPAPGEILDFCYVSFIAVRNNNVNVFRELFNYVYIDTASSDCSFLIVGLHSKDPLTEALKDFPKINYKSRLFLVYWDDGIDFFNSLDNRIPYLESATL